MNILSTTGSGAQWAWPWRVKANRCTRKKYYESRYKHSNDGSETLTDYINRLHCRSDTFFQSPFPAPLILIQGLPNSSPHQNCWKILSEYRLSSSIPRTSESVDVGWGLRTCICNISPGNAAILWSTLWESLIILRSLPWAGGCTVEVWGTILRCEF